MEEEVKVNNEDTQKDSIPAEPETNSEQQPQPSDDASKKESKSKFFKKKNKSPESDESIKKIAELTAKLEEQGKAMIEMNDRYIRLTAEFDNYKKRTLKEKMELTKYATEGVMLGIIPVVDDFERGLQQIGTAKEIEPIKEGVTLIYNKFKEFIAQKGIKEIDAKNQEFNTDLHEALTKIPSPTEELKGKVIDVIEKGYTLHDKVIRFSKVVVGE